MGLIIKTSDSEKVFEAKEVISIGSLPECDAVLKIGCDFMLTLSYDSVSGKWNLVNNFNSEQLFFKGTPLPKKITIDKICKLMVADSDEFITIKVTDSLPAAKPLRKIAQEDFTEEDIKALSGSGVNTSARIKLEKQKDDIDADRAAIIKEIFVSVNDLKKRHSLNSISSVFVNIALFLSSLVCAFGLSNYLMGLPIQDTGNFLRLPTNIKMLFLFTFIVFGISLILKQGVYLIFKRGENHVLNVVTNFMIGISSLFYCALYAVNVIYYMNPDRNIVFGILISLFFVGLNVVLSVACGYFKSNGHYIDNELNKIEYREDFERVLNRYRSWVERYINNLSNTKLKNIKDRLFNLQIKSFGETVIGFLTAPFLAYGVSNTLAMCFPEAAGWIRVSGLRFSPVFLVLSSFLIIFAFFAFVNAFLSMRKIQGAGVLKQDGFSNYLLHGTDFLGLEGIKKLGFEKNRSLVIAVSIIFIEFTMNSSYFMTEIGGDLQGILLSLIAALVPTALLIAETFMLSSTKYEIFASEELLAKVDKD